MNLHTRVVRASGTKGKEVRADGKGGTLKHGYYYKRPGFALGVVLVGPFSTKGKALRALTDEIINALR